MIHCVNVTRQEEVVDRGTFDELLACNKKFRKDWEEYIVQHEAKHLTYILFLLSLLYKIICVK